MKIARLVTILGIWGFIIALCVTAYETMPYYRFECIASELAFGLIWTGAAIGLSHHAEGK